MEKIWLKSYPADVPHSVSVDNNETIIDFFAKQCKKYVDLVAFENFGTQLTYQAVEEQSRYFAAYLQKQLRLKKGERIAIMLPNVLQFPITMFGAFRAGLVVVNVNPLYTAREIAYQLKDAGAKAIVVLENFASELSQALPKTDLEHVIVTKMGDCLGGLKGSVINFAVKYIKRMVPRWHIANVINYKATIESGKSLTLDQVPVRSQDIAFLQYTGGTTGLAKGAVLTHKNILANVNQCLVWIKSCLQEGKEVVVTALPLYHIFSLTGCFFFMAVGSCALLITNPRDMKLFTRILNKSHFSIFVGLNTLFNGLLNKKSFRRLDFSELKLVISGGMALQKSVAERWKKLTGNTILEGYGLTEASPVVTINPITLTTFNGSIGLPIPNTEVEIRDVQQKTLPVGKEGELCVRGPQVMRGYWQKPQETEQAIDAEGWLYTGDIARMDERGFVYIVDRKKDMIIVSGFNVYPNEIEEVLVSHPGVLEAAVIGVPSDKTGEAVKAFVVRRDLSVRESDIISYCRESLTAYKIPKKIEFRNELPKSNIGKILRRTLRDERGKV